jgi:hypothetical protein
LAACSGGGNAGTANPAGGAVHIVLDTAGGTAALVQAQIVAVTLERGDGSQTGNLLDSPENVTFSSPGGEAEGVELRHVDDGAYVALHFAIAPGTGAAQMEDGAHHSVDFGSNDLRVGFEDGFVHGRLAEDWVSVRHGAVAQLTGTGTRHGWSPSLTGGGAADDSLGGLTLHVEAHDANGLRAHIPGDDRGLVHVEIENETELFDDHGGRHGGDHGSWLAGVLDGDDVFVSGSVSQDGHVRGGLCRHEGNGIDPRLIGRITSLDSVQRTFEMDVLATALHGDRTLLQTPDHITVVVGAAEIHFARTQDELSFGDLAVGARVKVEQQSRSGSTVDAREIEVTSRNGLPAFPELEGLVGSVDVAGSTIAVVRRHDDPLLVDGQPVTSVTVHVSASTFLFRKASHGGERTVIALGAVVPTQDRIEVRGAVTGPASIDADWVRVRTDN